MTNGFNLNDTMIWEKTNPMPQCKQPRYADKFEYMFVFSKGKPKTFNPIMRQTKGGGKHYKSTVRVINTDNDTFTIYSSQIQQYDIYKYGDQGVSDGQDGKLWYFDCVNEDGLRCAVRLRIQSDGARQLYVDFSDASWVYNVYIK